MKIKHKYALTIFITGLFTIGISATAYYYHFIQVARGRHLEIIRQDAVEIAGAIDKLLIEKTKIVSTLGRAPLLRDALIKRNAELEKLPPAARTRTIEALNARWMNAETADDPFIQSYLSNPAAHYLKAQQTEWPAEYGEIFLTDRYGALTAATAKLTTLAHAHKYWWKGAYNNGEGRVFLDDRGYDDSVGDYVLGVVVPLREGSDVIGVLKCNLKILGAVSDIILDMRESGPAKIKLARSGGRIIYEKGKTPLRDRLPPAVQTELNRRAAGAAFLDDQPSAQIVGFSRVGVTAGLAGCAFGGSAASIDHKLGNKGETWHVVKTKPMDAVQAIVKRTAGLLFFIGLGLSGVLAVAALSIGRRMSEPVRNMAEATKKIGKGQFDKRLDIPSRDELGDLALSFNLMAAELQRTTARREDLEREIAERKEAQAALQEALAEKEVLLREIHHRVKNNMQVIISLLRMHSRKTADPRLTDVFNDCRIRIEAMSLIHESLYQAEDLSRIDFAAYIKKLCRSLSQAHDASGRGIALTADRCDVRMNLDKGIAVGMVIAELISNAFKHAFPSGKGGGVSVRLTGPDAEEAMELIIADDGVGLPADIDLENPPSLGLRLATGIVTRELGGSISVERDGGARFIIRFPCKSD